MSDKRREHGKKGGKKQPQIFAFSFIQQISPGFTVENIQQTQKKGCNFLEVCE